MLDSTYAIREAGPEDAPPLLELICELAVYERAPQAVTLTAERLAADLAGRRPWLKVWLALAPGDTQAIGMAFGYWGYSTWKGRMFYLEDLYVRPAYRRRGIGRRLLQTTLDYGRQEGAQRIAWQVLDWNAPAIAFYQRFGAALDGQWINVRLEGASLHDAPSSTLSTSYSRG
jgi:GNAT superfamily N-acetyltransferase